MRKVQLGEIVSITGGGTPDRANEAYWGGDIPWVTVKDFKSTQISGAMEHITPLGLAESASNLIASGSILVPTRMALGKVAINAVAVAINQDLKALSIKDLGAVDRGYLFRFLLSKASYFESKGKGATVKGITLDVLREVEVPLPSLEEQKRIAAILDKADSLRRKRQEALRLADDFLRAVFLDMFGDPVTNPKGWPLVKFSEVGELNRGKSRHRPRDDQRLYGGAYPFIQTGDVANADGVVESFSQTYSEFGLEQSRLWPAGTLCITIAANIGKTAILGFDACFPDSVVGFLTGNEVSASYVQFWLGEIQERLEEAAPQVAQKNINLQILSELDLPLPPLEMQEKFADIVRKTRLQKERGRQGVKDMDAMVSSLYSVLVASA